MLADICSINIQPPPFSVCLYAQSHLPSVLESKAKWVGKKRKKRKAKKQQNTPPPHPIDPSFAFTNTSHHLFGIYDCNFIMSIMTYSSSQQQQQVFFCRGLFFCFFASAIRKQQTKRRRLVHLDITYLNPVWRFYIFFVFFYFVRGVHEAIKMTYTISAFVTDS